MTDRNGENKKIVDADQFTMKTLKMRGIPRRQFEQYLARLATRVVDHTYIGDYWQVSLSDERQETIGVCSLCAVDVTMVVENDQFDDFIITFRKNFLRGGG